MGLGINITPCNVTHSLFGNLIGNHGNFVNKRINLSFLSPSISR